MKKKTILLINIFLFLFLSTAYGKQSLTIVTVDMAPLFSEENGLLTDIVRKSYENQGVDVHYSMYPLARINWAISEKKSCITIGTIRWFGENFRERLFYIPIYIGRVHLFYMKSRFPDGLKFNSTEDLQKYRIGTVRGGAVQRALTTAGITENVTYVPTLKQNISMISRDRIDTFVLPLLIGMNTIDKYYSGPVSHFSYAPKPLFVDDFHVIFTESCIKELETFKKGFSEIINNGEYLNLIRSYFINGFIHDGLMVDKVRLMSTSD
ncbi:transporter substrate-binding domain-containing protein [Vibrio profundum]|uniref:substrate-binding periplasmic protein n=1 Tax=Vibrio profundum TaxID=2910247 RepID=UPI003D0F613B